MRFRSLTVAKRVHYCGQDLVIEGVLTRLVVPSFPSKISKLAFCCVLELSTAESKSCETAVFVAQLVDPDGRRLQQLMHYQMILVGDSSNNNVRTINFDASEIVFPVPGDYQIACSVDNWLRSDIGLHVSLKAEHEETTFPPEMSLMELRFGSNWREMFPNSEDIPLGSEGVSRSYGASPYRYLSADGRELS